MARQKNLIPSVEKKICLPADLVQEVDAVLHNPMTDKPLHGGYSSIITGLLRQWLKTQKEADDKVLVAR